MKPFEARIQDRPVVLIGSGRCGSTLLQAILNTNPEFLIWGEHNGILRQIAAAYFKIASPITGFPDELKLTAAERIERLHDQSRVTAWDNLFDRDALRARFRIFIRSLFADPTGRCPRWGFKEIRYGRGSHDLVLPLLRECFPEGRFIFVVREPGATLFSMLSAWLYVRTRYFTLNTYDTDRQILYLSNLWAQTYTYLHTYLHAYPNEAFLVRYEDMNKAETYTSLARFLGTHQPFDYQSHVGTVKDASVKDDDTADFLRKRIAHLRPRIDLITRQTRRAYGYGDL
jgi:hypothetical protein